MRALLLCGVCAAVAGQQLKLPGPMPDGNTIECVRMYRLAADQYRAGDADKAAATFQGVDRRRLDTVVLWLKFMRAIPAGSHLLTVPPLPQFAWERRTLLSAGMLHVDLAMAAYLTQRRTDFLFQADLAAQLLAIADQPRAGSDESPGTAGRRSALAIGTKLLGHGSLDLAEQQLSAATQRFPDDAPIWLTFATVLETKVTQSVQLASEFDDSLSLGRARITRDTRLKEAATAFERVLVVDPACAEAQVRLGRVRTLEHDDAGATPLLNQALAARPPDSWVYLARLILGGIQERAGRPASAMVFYRAALAVQPEGQSGYIALSHALYASGDAAAAAAVLDRLFALHLTPNSEDPWWEYPFGNWRVADPILQALRDEARR